MDIGGVFITDVSHDTVTFGNVHRSITGKVHLAMSSGAMQGGVFKPYLDPRIIIILMYIYIMNLDKLPFKLFTTIMYPDRKSYGSAAWVLFQIDF